MTQREVAGYGVFLDRDGVKHLAAVCDTEDDAFECIAEYDAAGYRDHGDSAFYVEPVGPEIAENDAFLAMVEHSGPYPVEPPEEIEVVASRYGWRIVDVTEDGTLLTLPPDVPLSE
jgi:hypothetical protein